MNRRAKTINKFGLYGQKRPAFSWNKLDETQYMHEVPHEQNIMEDVALRTKEDPKVH